MSIAESCRCLQRRHCLRSFCQLLGTLAGCSLIGLLDARRCCHVSRPVEQHCTVRGLCRLQEADVNDPWLQQEWGLMLVASGRTQEALAHLEVAGGLVGCVWHVWVWCVCL